MIKIGMMAMQLSDIQVSPHLPENDCTYYCGSFSPISTRLDANYCSDRRLLVEVIILYQNTLE